MPWILFAFMWLAFAWMSVSSTDTPNMLHMQMQVPVFQQNCTSKTIPCVDDCSFLCVEQKVKCVGGACVVKKDDDPIDCDTEKGGMLMLSSFPTPHWKCLCTNESIWSGPACDTLNPDVCERGVFLYTNRNSEVCLCPFPYRKALVNGKWHCLGKPHTHFFPKGYGMVNEHVGPSRN